MLGTGMKSKPKRNNTRSALGEDSPVQGDLWAVTGHLDDASGFDFLFSHFRNMLGKNWQNAL